MLTGPTLSVDCRLGRRIVKTPMDPLGIAREHRAFLGDPVADGDHEIEPVCKKVTHGLREQR